METFSGRYLIFDHVIRTYEEIPKTIEILSPLVDYYCTIWNDGEPILISSSFDIKDDSMFQTFRQFWIHEVVDKT